MEKQPSRWTLPAPQLMLREINLQSICILLERDNNIIQHHRFGYCKFGVMCQKFHTNDTCDNFPCENDKCKLRHPKICNFFSSFGKCKFGQSCAYLHFNSKIALNSLLKRVVPIQWNSPELGTSWNYRCRSCFTQSSLLIYIYK